MLTTRFLADWAILATSIFNTILFLWLGLTVLLNAERRTWGIWLAGFGLLLSAGFFVGHTAIVGNFLSFSAQGVDFWWHLGWIPATCLPFGWYVLMLWYAGFWEDPHTSLHRRHLPVLLFLGALALAVVGLLLFANPFPSYERMLSLQLSPTLSVRGVPLLVLTYPAYIILSIGLTIDVLRAPGPTLRVMGELARSRARPWLLADTVALLTVAVLISWLMLRIVSMARAHSFPIPLLDLDTGGLLRTIAVIDLFADALLAVSVVLLGRAVVAYEIFTGKTLPRRGLERHWRNAVILAVGYSLVVGASLSAQMRPIYLLLGATALMTLFYALFSWRSYVERELYIDHLRPFVSSNRLYEDLLSRPSPGTIDVATPFRALCDDVLGVEVAYLAAVGPLSPLVGPPLAYPGGDAPPLPLSDITPAFTSTQTMCVPVEPARFGGAVWAVPLWSERGLVGVFFLGPKRGGGLYAQEEIEIARASGERLVDTQASFEMARRLMSLQRTRMAESQVLDRRTRRLLHDDVLPQLHAAMLTLSNPQDDPRAAAGRAMEMLAGAHREISDLLREMPTAAAPQVARLGLVGALQRVVADEFGAAFDGVSWKVEEDAAAAAQQAPSLGAEVLYYAAREAIRNAARYGRSADSSRPLHLSVEVAHRGGLEVTIEDDGVGIHEGHRNGNGNGAGDGSPEGDGVVSENGAGSGQGLALHSTMLAVVGGSMSVESVPGKYTRVSLTLPDAV